MLIFSVFISLSIANALYVLSQHLVDRFTHTRFIIPAFYIVCIIGMTIGTELSFMILTLGFDIQFTMKNHFNQLGLNLLFSLIVSTTMVLYEWKKSRYQLSSLNQEVEFVKLNKLNKQAQLHTIHTKINPHFLYNSLNAIAGLIPEDGAKAEAMTLKLAQLYRYSVSNAHENFSTISEELHIIKNYLEIEEVRFGDRFKFELQYDKSIADLNIPRFLLQPLVENAVKHGLSKTTGKAFIKLKISLKKNQISIAVYDNGEDFPKEINSGYGFKSIYDKVKLLYGDKHQIRLINSPAKHISIVLPVLTPAEVAEV
ncbi:MAG: sensor histidine kinase [Sphingobacteriaceae bacterium]